MATLKENFFKNRGLSVNPLKEGFAEGAMEQEVTSAPTGKDIFIVEHTIPYEGTVILAIFENLEEAVNARNQIVQKANAEDGRVRENEYVVTKYPIGVIGTFGSFGKPVA